MTDKPETNQQEPTPRPPRQPDKSLITYLERGDDSDSEEGEKETSSD